LEGENIFYFFWQFNFPTFFPPRWPHCLLLGLCTDLDVRNWYYYLPGYYVVHPESECSIQIKINQPTRYNNFSSLLLDVYVQLNMFRASSRPSSVAQQLRRPDHDQQHCYHHTSKVKPEAATAVVELLMMGVKTPETCWAVHKLQVINLRNFCV